MVTLLADRNLNTQNPQALVPDTLNEESCCRCLRRAWEVPSHECNALFFEDGSMLAKCDNCASARKDCVSVGTHTRSTCHLCVPDKTD